jgi:hypothetical protein
MSLPYNWIRRIKTLQSVLRLPDDVYREMLAQYGVDSCKKLDIGKAQKLCEKLESMAENSGKWQRYNGKLKYSELEDRGFPYPTAKQLRMIDALWKEVSFIKDEKERSKALDKFVKRIVGVDKLIWIEQPQVKKLVKAIKQMRLQQKYKKEHCYGKSNEPA